MLSIGLDPQDWNYILALLNERPRKESNDLFVKITTKAQELQPTAPEPTPTPSPSGEVSA